MNTNEGSVGVQLDVVNALLPHEVVSDIVDGMTTYQMLYTGKITSRALFSPDFFKNLDRLVFNYTHENSLTGILCIGNGYFFQYVEGSEESLTNLKNQLLINSRYINIKLYDFSKIDSRRLFQYQSGFACINNQIANTQLKCFLPFQPQNWSLSKQLEFFACVKDASLVKDRCQLSKKEKLFLYFNRALKLILEGLKQQMYLLLALVFAGSTFILMLYLIVSH